MLRTTCMLCNDKRKFGQTVDEVRNINYSIRRMFGGVREININLHHFDREDEQIYRSIVNDKKRVHFVCGSCFQINKNDLDREQQRLYLLIVGLVKAYKNESINKECLYRVLRIVQGHYPMIYREIERTLKRN